MILRHVESGYPVLIMKLEARMTESKKARRAEITVNIGAMNDNHNTLRGRRILPIVIITDNDVGYKISEARVVGVNTLSSDIEFFLKEGSNLSPTFEFDVISGELIDCESWNDVRKIPDYLSYDALQSIHIGGKFKR